MTTKRIRQYDGYDVVEIKGQEGIEIILLDLDGIRPNILHDTLYNRNGQLVLLTPLPNAVNAKA